MTFNDYISTPSESSKQSCWPTLKTSRQSSQKALHTLQANAKHQICLSSEEKKNQLTVQILYNSWFTYYIFQLLHRILILVSGWMQNAFCRNTNASLILKLQICVVWWQIVIYFCISEVCKLKNRNRILLFQTIFFYYNTYKLLWKQNIHGYTTSHENSSNTFVIIIDQLSLGDLLYQNKNIRSIITV